MQHHKVNRGLTPKVLFHYQLLFEYVVLDDRAMLLTVQLLVDDIQVPEGEFSAALRARLARAMENAALELAAVVGADGLVADHALVEGGL